MNLSRRSFLGGVAATASLPLVSLGAQVPKAKVAVQLYSVRDLIKKEGLEKVLKEVKNIGYAGVEFAGYWGKDAKTMKSLLDDNGLVACGTHIGRLELGPDKIQKTMEYNLTIGNTHLVCPGSGMQPGKEYKGTREDWWKQMAEFYSVAAETAKKNGCTVGYHNHQWEFKEKVGQMTMWEYFFSNTPAGVCMQLDVGWSVTAGTDPCSWFKRFPHRSPSLHAKEVFARGAPGIVGRPGKLADGTPRKGVDWDKLFVTTDLDGVKWYVVECETNPATLLSITESFAFLHQKGRC